MQEEAEKIVGWYKEKGRDFPWRKTEDPYEILLGELMLQKTSASQVLPIYRKMLEKYPSPKELSEGDIEEIAEVIYSLGLQNTRARRLKELAEQLEEKHDGEVPDDEESLRELPGVGEYISDSVLTLAFGEERTMIDANAGRVLGRVYFGEEDYSPNSDRIISKAEELLPDGKAREFNLAVIDLGASVCIPANPKCQNCPLAKDCEYFGRESSG